MNCETALAFEKELFRVETISFEKIPNQSKLFIDFQNNTNSIREFYPSKNLGIKELSKIVLDNYQIDRDALCDVLFKKHKELNAAEKTLANIEKLREKDCVAVIAGQQAGLFSGSMYTIYKALSAIRFAHDLTKQGIKAVPLFWIASEDHDFDEANQTFVIDQKGDLNRITNDAGEIEENTPVAFIELGENISATIDRYFGSLKRTEFTKDTKALLTKVYKESETYSSAFAKLILKLFSECGLILICPMNEDLRKLSSPIFVEAIEKHEQIVSAVLERDKVLAQNNYHSQVHVEEDFFPFFYIDENNKRNALRFDKETQKINSVHTEDSFTKEELIEIAKNSPHQLSPNVLMRSVVQDFLFPTVCYFGGSAEIAYFAQNEAVYRTLDRPLTQFRHRASFTIIDPKSDRTLKRYNLKFEDIFRGEKELLGGIIEEFYAPETAKKFADVEETINTQLNNLDQLLVRSDPTLADNLANRRKKIIWHIAALRNKFRRAESFKHDVLRKRIAYTKAFLYPRDSLQERTVNVIYFLNLFGPNFIKWLHNYIDLDEKGHQILFL